MAIVAFSGSYGSHLKFEVLAGTVSQSTTGNSSVVRLWCNLYTDGYASLYGIGAPLTIYVNGTGAIEQQTININTNSKITLWQKEYSIPHNPDGSKKVNLGLKLDINQSGYGSAEYRWDYELKTIQRASPLSAPSGVLGSPMTLSIDRKSPSFTHRIRYSWQGTTGTVANNVETSTTYTPPITFANNIPNSTSGTIIFYCDTYSGSNLVGTTQTTATLTIPASVVPTLSDLTLVETTPSLSDISTSTTFVQVLSNVKATIDGASGVYGSTIASYKIEVLEQSMTLTSNGGVFDFFKDSGSMTVRATVTDSRGRTSNNLDKTITVVPYTMPTGSFTATRTGADQDRVTVVRTMSISPLIIDGVQKNTLTLKFKYAPHGSTDYIESTGNANEYLTDTSSILNSGATLTETFKNTSSFDIIATLSDRFFPIEIKQTVGTIVRPLTITKGGVGIGKVPEVGNAVDSDWQYYFDNKPIQHHQLTTNDGTAIMLTDGSDLNDATSPGCYNGNNLLHAPTNGWNYIRVTKHTNDNGYILQEAISFDGTVSAFRVKADNVWKDWKCLVIEDSSPTFAKVLQTSANTYSWSGPYGTSFTLVRIGNLVTISKTRTINSLGSGEYKLMGETLPIGYRPATESVLILHANSGTVEVGGGVMHFSNDGTVKLTNGITNKNVWVGTTTFVTTDPFP